MAGGDGSLDRAFVCASLIIVVLQSLSFNLSTQIAVLIIYVSLHLLTGEHITIRLRVDHPVILALLLRLVFVPRNSHHIVVIIIAKLALIFRFCHGLAFIRSVV